jgi:GNAT superfamily N-acetyltransferase
MITYLKMRLLHIAETIRFNGVAFLLRELVYRHREAIVVEKDLSSVASPEEALRQVNVHIEEITAPVLARHALQFPVRNRALKALRYLKKGYGGFALVSGNEVKGDIWYSASPAAQNGAHTPDVKWLGIQCEDNYAYTFDMYLNPEHRGGPLASLLQRGALYELKKKGFDRAFGYFWANNIPALWVHRMLKWSERGRIKMTRFFFVKFAAHPQAGACPDKR